MIPLFESGLRIASAGNLMKLVYKPGAVRARVGIYVNIGWAYEESGVLEEEMKHAWTEAAGRAIESTASSFAFVDPPGGIEEGLGGLLVVPMEVVGVRSTEDGIGWVTEYVELKIPMPKTMVGQLVTREIGIMVSGLKLSDPATDPSAAANLVHIGVVGVLPHTIMGSLLGPIQLFHRIERVRFTSKSIDKVERHGAPVGMRLWATIAWDLECGDSTPETNGVEFYCLYCKPSHQSLSEKIPPSYRAEETKKNADAEDGEPVFLGTAFETRFRVSGLDLSDGGTKSMEVVVEGVSVVGEVVARTVAMMDF